MSKLVTTRCRLAALGWARLMIDRVHIHVVHIENTGFPGMEVGDAYMLDDLISLVRHPPPQPPNTLTQQSLPRLLPSNAC